MIAPNTVKAIDKRVDELLARIGALTDEQITAVARLISNTRRGR